MASSNDKNDSGNDSEHGSHMNVAGDYTGIKDLQECVVID